MSVIKESVFCEILENQDHPRYSSLNQEVAHVLGFYQRPDAYDPVTNQYKQFIIPVDREAVLTLLTSIKERAVRHARLGGKALRPHDYDDFSYLDRTQPWWGFEFETGWRDTAARQRGIEAAWDIGVNGVTFDGEGEGYYPVEITFSPAEMQSFIDGTAPAVQFIEYMHNHPTEVNHTGENSIGTHVNISLPSGRVSTALAQVLNNSIHHLPETFVEGTLIFNTRLKYFGRSSMYGGFYQRYTNNSASQWVEGKCFRTTYDRDQFATYIKACQALTKVAMAASKRSDIQQKAGTCINLLEMFEDPNLEPIFAVIPGYNGSASRSWISSNVDPYAAVGRVENVRIVSVV